MSLFAPSPWKWTRLFAIGLSASVAAFSVFGFIAPFLGVNTTLAGAALLAAICGNAQGLANCMAANARRAKAKGDGYAATFNACVVCFLGFGALSAFGLHNGWEAVKSGAQSGHIFPSDMLMTPLFLFAAFSEPAMNWVVESIKALARDEPDEQEPATPATVERPRLATVGGVALAVSGVAATVAAPSATSEQIVATMAPMSATHSALAAIVSTNTGYPSAREHALALKSANPALSHEAIAVTVGSKRSTVGKWLRAAAA